MLVAAQPDFELHLSVAVAAADGGFGGLTTDGLSVVAAAGE